MKKRETGFTLIELMLAVSIIGILVAIAYPNYTGYVVKTRRADAQGALVGLANAMERYYTGNNTYAGATIGNGANDIYPAQSPLDGGAKYYNLAITVQTATGYTLRATPISAQAADGYMELDGTGARRWDRNNDGDTADADETMW